jgi:kynurenine/2-aminoadipate aminotransferase
MQKALQYSPTAGLPDLVDWLKQLQVQMHCRDKNSFDICIGNGSQDVLTKAFEMLIDPGEVILIEAPAYSGTLSFLKPLGCNFAEVECDQDGLNPLLLERVLSGFDNESRPKVLYSVPVGTFS